ncbi:dentin sialophosphoprotein isoform X2 [Xenopus laevis]|uniref:Dentin sialophosphoprotein isoform X2 n=1 Tax=Xenopus laevis TaxID=8355 RepID=A0A8J1LDT5_XENLA|nr:dentin sialophosphoprotein isoform X2 [Xenopus laevis]
MINKVWDSQFWQLDMQLVGKLTLSATAAFILALAFRFYKSRVHERRGVDNGSGRSGNLDVGEAAGGHVNDETNELRCRRRKRTQHSDVISAAGSQSLAGDPVTAQEFNSKSQGGAISEYQSADGISTHQSGLNNETPETRAVASTDPKYHQKSLGNGNGVGTIGDNSDSGTVQSLKNTHKDIIGIIVGIIKDNPESGTVQPPKDSGKYVSEPNGIGTIGDNLDSGTVQPLKDSGKDISEPYGIGTIRDNLDFGTIQPPEDSGKDISDPNGIGTIGDNLDSGTVQPLKDSGKDISDPNGIGTITDNLDSGTVQPLKDSGKDISDPNGIGTISDNLDSGTVQTLKDSGKDISDPNGIGTITDNLDSGTVQLLKNSGKDISDPNGIGTIGDNLDSGTVQLLKDSGKDISDLNGIGTIGDNLDSGTVQPLKDSGKDISDPNGIGTISDNLDSGTVQTLKDSGKDISDPNGIGTITDNLDSGTVQLLKNSGKDISDPNGIGTIGDNLDSGTVQLLKDSGKDISDLNGIGTITDNLDSGTVQPLKDSGKDISETNGIGTITDNLDSGTVQPLKDSGKDISDLNGIGTITDNLDSGTVQTLKDSGKDISDPNGIGTITDNLDSGTVQPLKDSGKDISDPNGIGTIRDNLDSGTVQPLKDFGKDISGKKVIGTTSDNFDSGTLQPIKDISDPNGIGTIGNNGNSGNIQPLRESDKEGIGTIRDNSDCENIDLNDSGKDISDGKGIGTTWVNAHLETVQPLEGFARVKGIGATWNYANSGKIQPLKESGKDICDEKDIGADSGNIQIPGDCGKDICDEKGNGTIGVNVDFGDIQPLKDSGRDSCDGNEIGTIWGISNAKNILVTNDPGKDICDEKADETIVHNTNSGNKQHLKDSAYETVYGTTWDNHRQDPEVKETGNVNSGCVIRESSDISSALNENHKTMQEVHRFSSVSRVVVEENIISERKEEESRTSPRSAGLRGKIYEYHIESTSETVSPDKYFKFRTSTSPSSRPPAESQQDKQEVKVGLWEQGQDHHDAVLGPIGSQEALEAKGYSTPSGLMSPLRSLALKPANGSSPFHVSLSPDSTFDIHLGLENCFEVLSLAKKHNLDALKTAAYKVMSDNYLDVLQNPSVYRHLHAAERDLILERRMRGRRYIVVADIDTMGHSVSENSSLSYYDSDQDSWHLLSSMPPEAVSRACSMATMFNYVFIVLGCQGLERDMKPSKRVVCYNPVTDKWQDICPLNEARPHCKLVELDGYLYAIGGECLHTVERYDPWQNRWSYVAPLPNDTFAVAHMATAYDDEIYVTGGTIRYMLLRYLRKDNTWKSSIITGSKDRTTDLVAANNFLYRFDMNRSMGISVHRCSVRARIWYECATYTMPHPLPFQCAVIDNNIYCISRNFHLRFLTNDISPRFMEDNLKTLPCPKGLLSPLVLVLPGLDSQ